jgi:hypothetical protein
MTALIPKRGSTKSGRNIAVVYGVELRDAREEVFVMLVCDGLPMGIAFRKAGFESKAHDAPSNLFNLPRVQERAKAILEARRTQGAVTLPEVTDMLKRVFAGAHAAEEYSAAHNAAFSLARLYGHVTDRATLEVIRRPSRDPDAPSEQALSSWVEALPALPGPGPGPMDQASFLRVADAPAPLLGPEPSQANAQNPSNSKALDAIEPSGLAGLGPSGPEFSNEINWLGLDGKGVGGRPENGAPSGPVTGTPNQRAQSELLAAGGPGYTPTKKTGLIDDEGTGPLRGPDEWPSAEELFG